MPVINPTNFRTGEATIASAGTSYATATAILAGQVQNQGILKISAGNGTAGVSLPSLAGGEVTVFNSGTATAKIYPYAGGSINGSTNAASLTTLKAAILRWAAADEVFLIGG